MKTSNIMSTIHLVYFFLVFFCAFFFGQNVKTQQFCIENIRDALFFKTFPNSWSIWLSNDYTLDSRFKIFREIQAFEKFTKTTGRFLATGRFLGYPHSNFWYFQFLITKSAPKIWNYIFERLRKKILG